MAPSNLVALAASIREALASPQTLVAESKAEEDARLDIIDMLPDLTRTLRGEFQNLRDIAWSFLSVLSLNAVSYFNIATLVPLDGEISYTELASKSGLDLVALRQLVRHAITNRIFCEPSKDVVAHTSASRLLVEDKKASALISYLTDSLKLAAAHECDALERWPGSQSPRETGLSIGVGNAGQTSLYEQMMKDERAKERFSNAMEVWTSGEGYNINSLVEGYDWEKLGEGTLVDVGGANGFVSAAIANVSPSLNIVVQDIDITEAMKSEHQHPRIRFMAHDFFTPQPIKDADVYLYRWIFHNWGDDKCIEILRNAVPALKPGAKILINDGCLPVPGTVRWSEERMARNVDLAMLLTMNAKEREEADWQALFEKADARFKYLGARKPEGSQMWIIEAVWEEKGIVGTLT